MDNQQSNVSNKKMPIKFFWLMFLIAIIIYNIAAIFMAGSQENFKGFITPNDAFMPLLFYVFLAAIPINFFVLMHFKAKTEREQTQEEKQKNSIISYVFAEAMAVYGLILFAIAGDFKHLYLFSGLALVAMLLVFPRQ